MTNPIVARKIIYSGMAVTAHAFTWLEFEEMAWGTGTWLGELSLNWALILVGFTLFMLFSMAVSLVAIWDAPRLERAAGTISSVRERLGVFRWVLVLLVLIAPVWLLQYTAWGVVIHKPFLRLEIWGLSVLLLGVLITRRERLIEWSGFVTGLVLSAGVVVMAVPLQGVTDYPFSLGWSEGNRLWDYSVMFGRELYDYPADKPIPVLLDIGRQFVGGLVFLLPHVTIVGARLWVALTYILPYLVLGWVAFKAPGKQVGAWLLAGLWGYTFLNQGPIHPPLVVCAILVALAWRRPLWVSIPLVIAAGYLAQLSRWTWMFAPGMWLGMLELAGASTEEGGLTRRDWVRAISLGAAGVFGGYALPFVLTLLMQPLRQVLSHTIFKIFLNAMTVSISPEAIVSETTRQPLLWYRLLPNATYGNGILIALLIAIGPLVILLVGLMRRGVIKFNRWQIASITLSALAFLVVGLIISVKIGGGGDLHNMDMLLIGLLFCSALAFTKLTTKRITDDKIFSRWSKFVFVVALVLPAYPSLLQLWPISFMEQRAWIATLADLDLDDQVLKSLPSSEETDAGLETIREAVIWSQPRGEILFMDQRQLLTFGYLKNVPLVPEYDKKVLINLAMSGNPIYFEDFYQDLSSNRFSLIISSPLREIIQDRSYQFGEENNAWVSWVANPILCYYEPLVLLKDFGIQLLAPRAEKGDCSNSLPGFSTRAITTILVRE